MLLLSFGSNLSSTFGDRFTNIDLAVKFIESDNLKIIKKSSYYETPSYPDKKNPKFINIVLAANTNLNLVEIIPILISVEKKLGRTRSVKNEPRTCDIDIIDYKGQTIELIYEKQKFIIPHKKLSYRNFVLYPLQEILPKWNHPISKEPINKLIDKLSNDDKNSILKIKKN
tara:strand:- start:2013 stop:2525 length:513 start_codon:yes stop_codon:yes gene_type:complete